MELGQNNPQVNLSYLILSVILGIVGIGPTYQCECSKSDSFLCFYVILISGARPWSQHQDPKPEETETIKLQTNRFILPIYVEMEKNQSLMPCISDILLLFLTIKSSQNYITVFYVRLCPFQIYFVHEVNLYLDPAPAHKSVTYATISDLQSPVSGVPAYLSYFQQPVYT